jgi:hypothetical protein
VLSGLWNKNFSSNDYSLQIADTQLRARAAIAARAARRVIALRVNVFMGNIMAKDLGWRQALLECWMLFLIN